MKTDRRHVLGGLAALPLITAAAPYQCVTVYEAGRIITMEPSQPVGRFVAVADGVVLSVADSLADLSPWTDGRRVNLDRRFAGKVFMPGLIEPHLHPMLAAVMLNIPFVAPDDWDLPSASYPARAPLRIGGSGSKRNWRGQMMRFSSAGVTMNCSTARWIGRNWTG